MFKLSIKISKYVNSILLICSFILKGCWSFVGKVGGPQILSLQPPDKSGPNCLGKYNK
jgi:hypothetical protein